MHLHKTIPAEDKYAIKNFKLYMVTNHQEEGLTDTTNENLHPKIRDIRKNLKYTVK